MSLKKFLILILSTFSCLTAVLMGIAVTVFTFTGEKNGIGVLVLMVSGIMAAAAAGCACMVSKKYLQQVKCLRRAMKEAADGNLDTRCAIDTKNEIGNLSRDFNKMLLILKSSQDDLNFMKEMLAENEEAMRSHYDHIEYLAYHDTLTELPNKLAFYERVDSVLKDSKERKIQHSIFFIDLDNFKQINDVYGHEYGDSVLRQAAERLSCLIDREKDSIARIGGDEFLIFAYDIGQGTGLDEWKEKISEVFKTPFILKDEEFWVTMSVGCAVFPEHGENHRNLVRNADIAMYRAKQSGKNQFFLFDRDMEITEE